MQEHVIDSLSSSTKDSHITIQWLTGYCEHHCLLHLQLDIDSTLMILSNIADDGGLVVQTGSAVSRVNRIFSKIRICIHHKALKVVNLASWEIQLAISLKN